MDPHGQFCPNANCSARGLSGQGNIGVHSRTERRFKCHTCGKTFAATTGTPFYRLHKNDTLMVCVVTLLVNGCPPQAIVAAYGLDERTVADWHAKAGVHAEKLHNHFLTTKPVDLQHVQADELYAKRVGGRSWMAMAMAVPSRLWLGGVVHPVRDLKLIERVVGMVRRAYALGSTLLICVDGLSSYVTAFRNAFRQKQCTGRRGRPRFVMPGCVWLGQVIKKCSGRRLKEVIRRVVWGTATQIEGQLRKTKTGEQINTSYIERLNATFRANSAVLTRRGRAVAHKNEVLSHGMYLVGGAYNWCWTHRSLRHKQPDHTKWQERTPAMAAGWTDHVWTIKELLNFKAPTPLHG
jgi:transposase-like protein